MSSEAPCWRCGINMPTNANFCPWCGEAPAYWDTDFQNARAASTPQPEKPSSMRAAFCQQCGTYVPVDTKHCPKCHELHITQLAAERLLDTHPLNEPATRTARKKSKRNLSQPLRGERVHIKPLLPSHCPWCGAKLRWGEDKKRPGTWIALNAEKVSRPPDRYDRYSTGRGPSGWSFNLLIDRDQISWGGPYEEHMCSPEIDPLIDAEMWKHLIYVEAME